MNSINTILASSNPLSHVAAHKLFSITVGTHEIVFSNHMLMMLIAALLLMIGLPFAVRSKSMVPRGMYNLVESVCAYLREEMVKPLLHENTDRFIKYIWTVFFFILTCNLLGMVPLDSIIYVITGFHVKNIGGTATANIWFTGMLAICSFLMIHVNGVIHQGVFGYIKNFIPHVPWPMVPLMYLLEAVGALIKPFALAIRLFANMIAGHTMMAVLAMIALMSKSYLISGVTLVGCTAFSLLELFVALLQAYIFAFLTTMFISAAISPEH